ncbi:hypothetical protein K010075C41_07800 [Sellimonas intestinalis]
MKDGREVNAPARSGSEISMNSMSRSRQKYKKSRGQDAWDAECRSVSLEE